MIDRIALHGGSGVNTPAFIASIISNNLPVGEVTLIGRSECKLKLVAAFCQRLLDKNGFPTRIIPTCSLEEGVRDASYVINQIRVGGLASRVRAERIPPCFGMIGDEGVGAGAIMNAIRSVPEVLRIAQEVEQINANCFFIDLTNPVGILVEAVHRHTNLKVVGACNAPMSCIQKIGEILHLESSMLTVDYFGLNHFGWIQDIRSNGRSHLDRLVDRIQKKQLDGFDPELVRVFRMIPVPFVSFFFRTNALLKRQQARVKYRGEELLEVEQDLLNIYGANTINELPQRLKDRNPVWYKTTILPLIEALEKDEPTEIIACVPNQGCFRDLDDNASIEITTRVSKKGIAPARQIGESPPLLKGLFTSLKTSDRLAIEAATKRSYELALQALAIHPLVPSIAMAEQYLEHTNEEENLGLK